MRTYILTIICILTTISIVAQGIQFEQGTWAQVIAKAKATRKPIFVDAYTTWCAPCKRMAKEVFTLQSVGNYFNATFINYQMDMEKGEGIGFAKQWEVNAFPTLLYFDSDGKLSFKAIGAKDENNLLSQAKLALNPEYQLANYKKEYEEGGRTIDDLTRYVNKLREGGTYQTAAQVVTDYINAIPAKQRVSAAVWQLISRYIYDYKSPLFEFVLKNLTPFNAVAEKSQVSRYIFNLLAIRIIPGTRGADSREIYYGTLEKYKQYVPVDYLVARMLYFENLNGPEDSCYKYAKNLFDNKYQSIYEDDKLNYYKIYMANRLIEAGGEKAASATRWAQQAARANSNDYKNAFVLAQLLYKAGNKTEALKWAEKARTALAQNPEATVVQKLFKAENIGPFIDKLKAAL
jgi:thioredoxin-like negative regulator of GroEL